MENPGFIYSQNFEKGWNPLASRKSDTLCIITSEALSKTIVSNNCNTSGLLFENLTRRQCFALHVKILNSLSLKSRLHVLRKTQGDLHENTFCWFMDAASRRCR